MEVANFALIGRFLEVQVAIIGTFDARRLQAWERTAQQVPGSMRCI